MRYALETDLLSYSDPRRKVDDQKKKLARQTQDGSAEMTLATKDLILIRITNNEIICKHYV